MTFYYNYMLKASAEPRNRVADDVRELLLFRDEDFL